MFSKDVKVSKIMKMNFRNEVLCMLKSLSSPTSILNDMTKYIPDIVKIKFSN